MCFAVYVLFPREGKEEIESGDGYGTGFVLYCAMLYLQVVVGYILFGGRFLEDEWAVLGGARIRWCCTGLGCS